MNGADETLEDLVIRALSHSERKNILKIVASYPEGVNYTGILGESGLSTGKLNYHLGQLTGCARARNKNRIYYRWFLTSCARIGVGTPSNLYFKAKSIISLTFFKAFPSSLGGPKMKQRIASSKVL